MDHDHEANGAADHGHCEACEARPYWWLDTEVLIATPTPDLVEFSIDDGSVEVPADMVERFCREFLEHRERRRAAR